MSTIPSADPHALYAQTVTETSARIARGEVNHEQVLESQLGRIAAREPSVHAFKWHDAEQVRSQLAAVSSRSEKLPLAGIAIGIKDIIDTADMPTEYGSAAFVGNRPAKDAAIVTQLKAAGAVMMGKTVTTEFASQFAGATVNPHNFAHTPGGSSSGSAAAVADGMVGLALGTQTAGSTIRPAAYCGIVGFKATRGKISLEGVNPLSPTLDTMGWFGRSVGDVKLLASVLLGESNAAEKSGTMRLGWYPGPEAAQADAQAVQALERAKAVLRAHGIELVDVEVLPAKDMIALGESNRLIMSYEMSRFYEKLYRNKAPLGDLTVAMIEFGLQITEAQFNAQREHAERCRQMFAQAAKGLDAVLTLASPGEAPLTQNGTGSPMFNRTWTSIGVPCLGLPFGKGGKGLPLAIQLVATEGQDHQLLAVGGKIESLLAKG
jgi:Asp-tRNA(Asn)/Glu-tRNA(Gln) amidotransferase A subunit family amidase